jgi:cytochrome c biogenesis protein
MTTARRPSVRQSVALVWRTLRSMRTALVLLLILAAGSVIGSLLPQVPNSPERVGRYLDDHGLWGPLFFRAGFFDVYGSWWFVLITTLLFVSLAACLFPRTRALVRAIRQRPVQARELDAFPHHAEVASDRDPDGAAREIERLLRRRRFRVERDGPAVAAEKGVLREAGSLLFHWAFFLLIVGVIVGKGTGFAGRAVVTEGETWIDALPSYDGQIRTGRYFGGGFTGIGIRLLDFEATYRRNGQPIDFVSRVELLDADGRRVRTQEIRVNHPASVEGLRVFQEGFGWAPVVQVSLAGDPLWSSPIEMARDDPPEGVPGTAMPWRGSIKMTAPEPDVMITLELWSDYRAYANFQLTGRPTPMLVRFDPYIRYSVHVGRILDPALAGADTTGLRRVVGGDLRAAGTSELSVPEVGELRLSFPELRQYSVLLISRDVGVPVVLAAAILVLVGLLPALYVSRRKVWTRAAAAPGGSVVSVGGLALQRKDAFEEEFGGLVRSIETATGGATARRSQPVGTP